jgi:molybdopterin-guanine dinucleotide biosynthesis protein A
VTVSAIVLAGGRSTRFGRDKLAEPLDGMPMLWRTIEAVQAVADDIVVVVAPGSDPELPADVRVAYDLATGQGPLVGVLAGLEAVRNDAVLVVGGDMPWLHPVVLGLMLASLEGSGSAVALEVDTRAQQLPLVVRREAALSAARGLVESGERRLGALLEALDVATIAEADWRAIDPGADTLRDVDVPEDVPPSA